MFSWTSGSFNLWFFVSHLLNQQVPNIIKLFFQSRCLRSYFRIYNRPFENSEGMVWVWFSVHSQSTPLQMAASRAGTLLCYFKRGREDEERKDEENANTGDSQLTRVKRAKKDRDFKPAWERILCGL